MPHGFSFMPTVTISRETREKLRVLAEQEGKSVEEYAEEILSRAALRAQTAEELIQKLGLETVSKPTAKGRSSVKRVTGVSKRAPSKPKRRAGS